MWVMKFMNFYNLPSMQILLCGVCNKDINNKISTILYKLAILTSRVRVLSGNCGVVILRNEIDLILILCLIAKNLL
jgi:hypothetical protein